MSFSAHKNYGPKGVGALYVRNKPRVRIQPQILGGGHEQGLRSGTLATHQVVGMGEAFALSEGERKVEQQRLLNYRNQLWEGIHALPRVSLNGHAQQRVAGNLNMTFAGLHGDSLLYALHELALSTSSACTSSSIQPSYVLKALGLSDELAHSSIRLSLGRFTQQEDITRIINIMCKQIKHLHTMAP
jgi:cysteine desulfurase